MKRALVTGAAGFVGANLARRLLVKGHEVHVLLRADSDPWRLAGVTDDLRIHRTELADETGVRGVVAAVKPEWVFHLAVHGAYASQTDPRRMLATNIVGTMNLVEACLATGFEALVNTGSSSEYGFQDHAPSEDEPVSPNSYYAVTKASATLYCRYVAQRHRVHLPTLRLYSVYGPFEEPGRLIPTLIAHGLQGRLPPLVSPDTARDYVYVDDVGEAYLAAATGGDAEWGAVFNVGTGRQTALREVVELARRVLAIATEPRWGTMPARAWDTAVWRSDPRKIRQRLAWEPRHTLERGFERTVEWLRANPAHRPRYESPT